MSKKTLLVLSITLVTILFVLVGYYFITQTNPENPNGSSGFKNFFPFGGNDNATTTPRIDDESPKEDEQNFTQKLRKISVEPVAGAGILDTKQGSIIRHIEKATGHIYETESYSPRQERISNTTIPLAYDASWGNKNLSLVVRYLREDDKTVDTYTLTLKEISTSTENNVSAISFPSNITDVSILNNNFFYLQQNQNSSVGFISDFLGKNKKQVWNSEIRDLNIQYASPKTVTLTTKPAPGVSGYMYSVDTGTGVVKKVLGDISGLSTLMDTEGNQVVYLAQNEGVGMYLFNQRTSLSTSLSPTTFPEKCVWSKKNKEVLYCAVPEVSLSGNSLTYWYQGLFSSNDSIWKYDTKNNTASIIADLYNEGGEIIDVIKPILSENEQYLVFINKKDDSLWSLDLNQ